MALQVVLITQEDRFFLPDAIAYLLARLPSQIKVAAVVLLGTSPFGKRKSFLRQSYRTWRTFGLRFFLRYGARFIWARAIGYSVRKVITESSIPLLELKSSINSDESLRAIGGYVPDVIVSIASNEIFRKDLIALPKCGIINLHTAKLPKYRGLMPSFWVLADAETETAATVFFVDEGIDSGPIIVQEPFKIGGRTLDRLIRDTKLLGMEAVRAALLKIDAGEVKTTPNDKKDSTYYHFPTRSDVKRFRSAGGRFY